MRIKGCGLFRCSAVQRKNECGDGGDERTVNTKPMACGLFAALGRRYRPKGLALGKMRAIGAFVGGLQAAGDSPSRARPEIRPKRAIRRAAARTDQRAGR